MVLTVNAQRQIHRIVLTRTHPLHISRTPSLERGRNSTTTMIAQSMGLVTSGANVTKINMVTILGPAVPILLHPTLQPQVFNSPLKHKMFHCLRHLRRKCTSNREVIRMPQATCRHPAIPITLITQGKMGTNITQLITMLVTTPKTMKQKISFQKER